jgi:DNA invertase Pin-like site-specific DNA recombinase
MTNRRVALYLRVSTLDQDATNQRRELEAVVRRHGWRVVAVFSENGVSGAKGRAERPGLDEMMKAVARRDVDMVAAWSVDRLGRSLQGLLEILVELRAKGSTSTCTSRASTPAPRAGRRCTRCWASSRS